MNKLKFTIFLLLLSAIALFAQKQFSVGQISVSKSDISLKQSEAREIDGIGYVKLVEEEDHFISETSGAPQIPCRNVYLIIPRGSSIDDVDISYSFEYGDQELIEYRLAPSLSYIIDEKIENGEKVYAGLPVWDPQEQYYESQTEIGVEVVKSGPFHIGSDVSLVNIQVPLIAYSPGLNRIRTVRSFNLSVTYPSAERTSDLSLYEDMLEEAINYRDYLPRRGSSRRRPMDGGSYAASDPVRMNAADLTNPDKDIDYIIITAEKFFPLADTGLVWTFANHKKDYRNLNVAIFISMTLKRNTRIRTIILNRIRLRRFSPARQAIGRYGIFLNSHGIIGAVRTL